MRTIAAVLFALAVAGAAAPAAAIDDDGRFMMKGVGARTCQDLLQGNGVTRESLDVFLDGFVTAANIERDDTYDIVPGADWSRAIEWIVAYCGQNRGDRVAIAAYRMIENHFPRRQKSAPQR